MNGNGNNCPYSDIPEHTSVGGCVILPKSDKRLYQHVFNSARYTINSNTGIPLVYDTEFNDCINLSNFQTFNSNIRCTTTSNEYVLDDFVHLSVFKVSTIEEFWWFLDSLFNIWNRINNDVKTWPHTKTMLDVLVPSSDKSTKLLFLRPIFYSKNIVNLNRGLSIMIFNLFKNSWTDLNDNILHRNMKRPQKLFCSMDCKFRQLKNGKSQWWNSIHYVFGKNMYIHTICCTQPNKNNLNAEWFTFVRELIKMRRIESLNGIGKSAHKNQIVYFYKKWLRSLDDITTNDCSDISKTDD